jgi:hypothetical protein
MTSSAQLEREAEAARARLAATLDELRQKVTPGQVVDQLFDYARDSGAGDFFRNLGRDIVNNPLPLGFLGVGLGWLMVSNGRRSRRAGDGGQWDPGAAGESWDTPSALAERTKAGLSEGTEQARQVSSRLSEAAGSVGASVKQGANVAADRASAGAARVADGAAAVGRASMQRGADLVETFRSQPLLLAGLGLMIGAAVGAAVPSTRTEQELMGEASRQAKQRAQSLAEEHYDAAKETVQETTEGLRSGIKQGLRESLDQVDREIGPDRDTAVPPAGADDATLVPSGDEGERVAAEPVSAAPYVIRPKPGAETT